MSNRRLHRLASAALLLAAMCAVPGSALAQAVPGGAVTQGLAHLRAVPADPATGAPARVLNLSPQQGVSTQPPPRDPVGGFVVGVLAGVQLRGSASGQFGVTLGWFKQSTSNVGFELEGAYTRGPDGEVYHGLLSVILQSGSRSTRMVPYLALGGGLFNAREKVRDAVAAALPDFGIDASAQSETGGLIAAGFGIRYYLNEKMSFRADYREMRAITTASGSLIDRLHSMRRIAGILMIRF